MTASCRTAARATGFGSTVPGPAQDATDGGELVRVEVHRELEQVVLRHDNRNLLVRGAAVVGLGIGVPAWVQASVPAVVVPALVVTLATALWLVQALTAVLVLDDAGVTTSASRRGPGRTAWDEVTGIGLDDQRVVVTTAGGRRLHGPPADAASLERALAAARALDLLPARLW